MSIKHILRFVFAVGRSRKHKPSSNLLKQSGCTTWEL